MKTCSEYLIAKAHGASCVEPMSEAREVKEATRENWSDIMVTDGQMATLEAVSEKYGSAIARLRLLYAREKGALSRLMRAEYTDDSAIRAQVAKMASVQADIEVQRAHALSELRGLFTAEQMDSIHHYTVESGEDRASEPDSDPVYIDNLW